jgi:hypothetical protein
MRNLQVNDIPRLKKLGLRVLPLGMYAPEGCRDFRVRISRVIRFTDLVVRRYAVIADARTAVVTAAWQFLTRYRERIQYLRTPGEVHSVSFPVTYTLEVRVLLEGGFRGRGPRAVPRGRILDVSV